MPAYYDHANSLDWWDGPERFKRINRCEVAMIQNEVLLNFIDRTIKGYKIDIGGPTGNVTNKLKSFITLATEKQYRIPTYIADACNLPFKDETFSVVFSSHTIEHIHNLKKFFMECDRVLQNGGIMITVCPNRMVHQHDNTTEKVGEKCFQEFVPEELLSEIKKHLPNYNLLSFNTRNNNFDFDIILRKPE